MKIVGEFNDYLSRIAERKDQDEENKYLLVRRAQKYFLDTAMVEVSNKNSKAIHTYSLSEYLTNIVLKYKERYRTVEFEAVPLKHSEFTPIYKNNVIIGYEGVVEYRQIFKVRGFDKMENPLEILSNNDYVYFDVTKKSAIVHVRKMETVSGDAIWIIRLGDIKVISTSN